MSTEQQPTVGWACTKKGVTKYHYYTADGKKLCRYQAQPGPLHFWTRIAYGRRIPEQACSSCELAYSRLPKERQL